MRLSSTTWPSSKIKRTGPGLKPRPLSLSKPIRLLAAVRAVGDPVSERDVPAERVNRGRGRDRLDGAAEVRGGDRTGRIGVFRQVAGQFLVGQTAAVLQSLKPAGHVADHEPFGNLEGGGEGLTLGRVGVDIEGHELFRQGPV